MFSVDSHQIFNSLGIVRRDCEVSAIILLAISPIIPFIDISKNRSTFKSEQVDT